MTNTITPLEFSLRDERNRAEVTVETFTPPPDPLLFECWKENWGDGDREGRRNEKGTCAASGQSADVNFAGLRKDGV